MKRKNIFKNLLISLLLTGGGITAYSLEGEAVRSRGDNQVISETADRLPIPENHLRPANRTISPLLSARNGVAQAPSVFNSALKAPSLMSVTDQESSIYGWLGFADTNDDSVMPGFTQVYLNGNYQCLFKYNGLTSFGFWIRNEKVCTYGYHEFFGMMFANQYDEYDMATGKVLSSANLPMSNHSYVVLTHAYDALNDMIYGYTFNEAGNGYKWFTAPGDNPTEITHVRDASAAEFCVAMTVNQMTHELIGINANRRIVSIDPTNGNQTELAKIDLDYDYVTGMCYSPMDGYYIWNEVDKGTELSHLYAIDPETYSLTKLAVCKDMANYTGMYCTDKRPLDPSAPADPVLKQMNFKGGDLKGYIVYGIPSTTVDGKPIQGRVEYTAMLDGEVWTSGSVPTGNDLFVPFDNLSNDYHAFTLTLSVDGKLSRDSYIRKWIGYDYPVAPEEVIFENNVIRWTPVTTSVHDGYLDVSAIRYDVYMDDELIAEDLDKTTFNYTIPDGVYTLHHAKVVAKANGHSSDEASSNGILCGTPLSLPLEMLPTAEESKLFNIVDWNADGYTFDYFRAYDGEYAFCYHQNASRPATDWLFLPAFEITDPEKVYRLSWDAFVGDERYPEKFDIWLGQNEPTPYGMVGGQHILKETKISNKEPQRMSVTFKVKEPGAYFIGFRCDSDPNMYLLLLRNFSVKATDISPEGPAAVSSASATALPNGHLKADVTAVLPTIDMSGQEIDSATEITLEVESDMEKVSVKGLPGAAVNVEVETNQGFNKLLLTTWIDEAKGDSSSVEVYTGNDRPGLVKDLEMTASEDGNTLNLTWTPNEVGANGGYAAHADTHYYLCVPEGNVWRSTKYLGSGVTSCSVDLGKDAEQKLYEYGILTLTEEGQADYLSTASCVAGKAHKIPMKENFEGNTFNYAPIVMMRPDNSYTASWAFDQPYKVGDVFANDGHSALIAYAGNGVTGKGRCLFPLFSTENTQQPTFTVRVNNVGCEAKLFARTWNTSFSEIASIEDTDEEYKTITVDIPSEYKNMKWVQIAIDVDVPSTSAAFVIDGYSARDPFDMDLAVSEVLTPASLIVGEPNTIETVITNEGRNAISLRELTLKVSDKNEGVLLDSKSLPELSLNPDKTATIKFEVTPEIDWGTVVNLSVGLVSGDDNEANDAQSMEIPVKLGRRPAVTDLRILDKGDDYVELAWTEPELTDGMEGFEDETAFILSPAMIGKFRNIDLDGKKVYGMEGLPNVFMEGAFSVYSNEAVNDNRFSTEWGDKFIIAYCPGEGTAADDWLISPEVVGGSEFSFKIRPLTYQYGPEVVEVCYSTTADKPSEFKVLKTIKTEGVSGKPTVWVDQSFTLPEDAKYFALHYVSADIFGIMLDEFRFSPVDATPDVDAYDILRNNKIIAEATKTTGTYRDNGVDLDGKHHLYNVVPVLVDGSRSCKSNTVSTQFSGIGVETALKSITGLKNRIVVNGFAGKKIEVYDLAGNMIISKKTAESSEYFEVASGVYVVTVEGFSAKIYVR